MSGGTVPTGLRVWLARHGETEWSRAMRHTGRTDLPLTSEGRRQARALAPHLEGTTFAHVLCSPLLRARQTLELALPGVAAPELDDDLMERDYGAAEGITTVEMRERTGDPTWESWTAEVEGAETIDEVGARTDRVVDRVLRCEVPEDGGADVLVVAHGHLLRILAARWLEQPAAFGQRLTLSTSAFGVLGFERERRVLRRWNVGG
ncbi:histidine phosphatase family protein [Patulibacter sp. S7RM1-6]